MAAIHHTTSQIKIPTAMKNPKPSKPEPQKCASCGAIIAPGVPENLCPACLLANVIGSQTDAEEKAETLRVGEPAGTERSEIIGGRIGRYKLLQKLGEGGCGVVYMAEQTEPMRRRVALKVIKLGMDTKTVIARFEAERQALAMMDHTNIARVFDAGATETGRPFFVMELVKGIRITDYCDQNKLSTRERLELFKHVCQAIQHAHQKGIVHRDIKPSNILVTLHDGVPVPKVIDFGIAKATDQQLTDKTVFTVFGQFIGTPAYMSPEQAELSGLDTDTRTDIYSLGVLLYELLTGTTPFDPRDLLKRGLDEIRRTIREVEPPRPSTKVSTLAAADLNTVSNQRQCGPAKLSVLLRGDLDWMVMKCLEKDRTRRYETANGLASDVEHHLNDEPVTAGPPTGFYRLQKLVRRNKVAVSATAMVALSVLVGLSTAIWSLVQEKRARQRAEFAERDQAHLRQQAEAARDTVGRATRETQYQLAATSFQRALLLCEQGEVPAGVLSLGRALELAHEAKAADVEQDCRWNLDAWARHLSQLTLVLPHPDQVLAVALSPDDRVIASGCKDGAVRFWDAATGEPAGRALTHGSPVQALAFHPHQPRLVAAGDDGAVTLWNLETGTRLQAAASHTGQVMSAIFSPDGATVLTGSWDGTARLWKTATMEPIGRPSVHQRRGCPNWGRGIIAVFSPDGQSIATGGGDEWDVRFWDPQTGERQSGSVTNKAAILTLAWAKDGRTMLVGMHQDFAAYQRDIGTGRTNGPRLVHFGRVNVGAYSGDGKTLVTGSHDQAVRVWDAATGKLMSTPMQHRASVTSVAISSDGKTVTSGSADQTVRVWKTATGNLLHTLKGFAWFRAGEFSPDSKTLFLAIVNTGPKLFDVKTGRALPLPFTSPAGSCEAVAFSPDGKRLYAGFQGPTRRVHWWDRDTGEFLARTGFHGVWRMTLSPDGKTLLTGGYSEARLWNTETGESMGTKMSHPDRTFALAFSPDNETFVIGCYDGTMRLWSAKTGQPLGPRFQNSNEICAAAFSPDGMMILTGGGDRVAQLWDPKTWTPQKKPMEHRGEILGVSFSADGKMILTASADGTARLWNTTTCQPIGPALSHNAVVNFVKASPDQKTIATGSDDRSAKLWVMPVPITRSALEAVHWLNRITGLQLDENGATRVLDADAWLALQATSTKTVTK